MKKILLSTLIMLSLLACSKDGGSGETSPGSSTSGGSGSGGNASGGSASGCGYHNGKRLYKGAQGGCYYINSNGNKTYVDRSECNC
ncbi:hypothetical protein [Chitinophaga japonensis]|uniref:Lipoprotein n=1 Tax=Chitinophaga japonensis TaxID=104662 RepID=A0A562T5D8_CHIJA|nr:hypothetical protein [Chitinophaga japonensis]TWI88583.1 hypothetical protein LX66_2669 [Chitinophaga japonensis]